MMGPRAEMDLRWMKTAGYAQNGCYILLLPDSPGLHSCFKTGMVK